MKTKRFIFIGDVHGCYNELCALIEKTSPSYQDTVIFLGDFVDRGPHPDLCIRMCIERGFHAILGNHDLRLLDWKRGKDVPKGEDLERSIELVGHDEELIEYISHLPLYTYFPEINTVAVHAALDVNKTFSHQFIDDINYDIILRGRYIRKCEGSWRHIRLGTHTENDPIWADFWTGPEYIIYGHTPYLDGNPRLSSHAIGIDTGCVYGVNLSAAIYDIENGWSIDCVPAKEQYWPIATPDNLVYI